MERNLLIHSMSEFSFVTLPILTAINAKIVCEIGAEHGGNSKILYEWTQQNNATLISIDPKPSPAFLAWLSSTTVRHIAKNSHEAIAEVKVADAWYIDGDHNWYTVFNELNKIREFCQKENHPFLIFLHDVGWPWARRDLYYAPEQIPEKFRHAYTREKGVTLDCPGVIEGGFRSNGSYAIALQEGGARNGVLTAIEDFIRLYPQEFCFAHIPAVFGLGVLFNVAHPHANAIATLVSPYHNNPLLKTLELNRLDNYLKVIQLQDNEVNSAKVSSPIKENLSFNPEHQYQKFEKIALDMVDLLKDEQDHPDLWELVSVLKSPAEKAELKLFSEYLSMLMSIPQDNKALKILAVIEAICLAQCDEVQTAKEKLDQLCQQHPNCPLVIGALSRAMQRIAIPKHA